MYYAKAVACTYQAWERLATLYEASRDSREPKGWEPTCFRRRESHLYSRNHPAWERLAILARHHDHRESYEVNIFHQPLDTENLDVIRGPWLCNIMHFTKAGYLSGAARSILQELVAKLPDR